MPFAEPGLKTLPEVLEQQQVEAAQRDPSQFAALYESHFERVFAFVARRMPTREDAEDVTSEVFHQALASLENFRWQGAPFVSWLFGIAVRLVAKRWHQLGRQPNSESEELEIPEEQPDPEQQTLFTQLVEQLPGDQRLVVLRRFVEQRSIREIALEMGRSEGAIKQLQFRALEHLRSFVRPS